jgi:hypothetical protein
VNSFYLRDIVRSSRLVDCQAVVSADETYSGTAHERGASIRQALFVRLSTRRASMNDLPALFAEVYEELLRSGYMLPVPPDNDDDFLDGLFWAEIDGRLAARFQEDQPPPQGG